MAKKIWVLGKPRSPRAKPSDEERAKVVATLDAFVKNVLKPRFLPEIEPTTQFNYPIDIIGEWRAGRYRFLQRFRSDAENRIVEEFDAPFARIDYIGPDRFDIYWMRHTGAWWALHRSVTLDDALKLMIDDGHLHPV